VLQNFILNTVSDWFNDKELTQWKFPVQIKRETITERACNLDLYSFIRRRNLQV